MASIRTCAAVCVIVVLTMIVATAEAEVRISSGTTENIACAGGVCAPTADKAVLNINDLETLLASGDVEVTTSAAGVQATNIRVDGPLGWSNSSTLALDAFESVWIEKSVTVSGQGGLSITTKDGGNGGVFAFGPKGKVTFADTSSMFSVNGGAYALVSTLPSLASAIASNPSGAYALADRYDASADGTYTAAPIATTFTGNFEGLGNTISHLMITGSAPTMNIGLFADVDTSGTIASLRLTGAKIKAKNNSTVGAMAANNKGLLFNSFAAGEIKVGAGADADVGGGIGLNLGNVQSSGAAVAITVGSQSQNNRASAGGLVGSNVDGTIESCYALGSVTVTGPAGVAIGGLVGFNNGIIENSYAEGAALQQGTGGSLLGGLVGLDDLTMEDSYSTGLVSGGGSSYVGLLGFDNHSLNGGTISHTYWDRSTSGIKNKSQGAGNIANDPGVKGQTTAQLQSGLPKGFDRKIWAENPNINGGLPYLIANPPGN